MLTRDGDYFVPLGKRLEKGAQGAGRPVRVDPRRRLVQPSARGLVGVRLSEKGASSTAAALAGGQVKPADTIGGVNSRTTTASLASVLFDLSTTAQINDSLKLASRCWAEMAASTGCTKARSSRPASRC